MNDIRKKRFLDIDDSGAMYGIYQLKRGEELRDYLFTDFDLLKKLGKTVERKNYELIYAAPLEDGVSLEDIYTKFNIDHPQDFKGHSLSVSDIVVLKQDGRFTAHYVDSFGYKAIPRFMSEAAMSPRKKSDMEM